MLAVYNQHLLLSGTPVVKFRGRRWQHTPMADTPHSQASSAYDLEDSFLAEGKQLVAPLPTIYFHLEAPILPGFTYAQDTLYTFRLPILHL